MATLGDMGELGDLLIGIGGIAVGWGTGSTCHDCDGVKCQSGCKWSHDVRLGCFLADCCVDGGPGSLEDGGVGSRTFALCHCCMSITLIMHWDSGGLLGYRKVRDGDVAAVISNLVSRRVMDVCVGETN